jgi:uncharacterized membrane protein YhaH (DUF805 family)
MIQNRLGQARLSSGQKEQRMSPRIGLRGHFRKLATFRGREDRSSFWPYAALVLGIVLVAGWLIAVPMVMRSMQAMRDFTPADRGDATFNWDAGEFSIPPLASPPDFMPSPGFLAAYLAVTFGLAVLLYAAAVVRRLHDRGNSGAWGLMPLPFLAYTIVQMVRLFGSMGRGQQPDMTLFLTAAVSSILYWAALLALIVLLAGASDPGPNRYDAVD